MVPEWIQFLANSWLFLLLASGLIVALGLYKLRSFIVSFKEEKAEEEQKRKQFLAKLDDAAKTRNGDKKIDRQV